MLQGLLVAVSRGLLEYSPVRNVCPLLVVRTQVPFQSGRNGLHQRNARIANSSIRSHANGFRQI